MSNNRDKGHGLERQVVCDLREQFKYCKTSRQYSKQYDDCGIDIACVPFKIQCKNGYAARRPKYEEEYRKVTERTREHMSETHVVHRLPFILIHKMDFKIKGKPRPEELTQVTMSYDYFLWLVRNINPELNLEILQ